MRRIIPVLLFLALASCSSEGSLRLTVDIPRDTHIEKIFSESAYFTLSFFDGAGVRRMHVPIGVESVGINVHRGSSVFIMISPPEGYAPLISWYEPGMDRPVQFRHDGGALMGMLLELGSRRPAVLRDLSLTAVEDIHGGLDRLSPERFVSHLEKGSLSPTSPILEKRFAVELESLLRGIWVSDRSDIPSIVVRRSGDSVRIGLYPGEYRFLSVERDMMLTIAVDHDGRAVSSVGLPPKWA